VTACCLDSSALVKRYIAEVGSTWIQQLTDFAAGNEPYTVTVTGPEMISAVVRRARGRGCR
jgi:uncharacterized protein